MTAQRDAQLSALLDGALSASEEVALRAELARDPALASRLAELARVDAALRALPERPVPANLRARLQAKLDVEARAEAEPARARPALAVLRGGAARRRWVASFAAAAAAAALAIVVVPALREPEQTRSTAGAQLASRPPAEVLPLEPSIERAPSEPAASAAEPSRATAVAAAPAAADRSSPAAELVGATPDAPASGAPSVAGTLLALEPEAVRTSDSAAPDPAPMPSPSDSLAAAAPAEGVLLSDSEIDALEGLELEDASVVAVLDLLDALDSLEPGAS